MSDDLATRRLPDHIRFSEHEEVVPEPYHYRSELKYRHRHVRHYAACCLRCMENTTGDLLPRVRQWARDHECEPGRVQ